MPQAELFVLSGKQTGTVIPLPDGKFLIGREEDCHLRPNSDLVSRHHCAFTVDEFTVRLRDLGSTNGTFVNGERIRGGVVLSNGDIVSIGKIEFRVVVRDPSQETVSNLVLETGTQLGARPDVTDPAPAPAPTVVSEGSSVEIPVATPTTFDLSATVNLPEGAAAAAMAPPTGDTRVGEPMFAPPMAGQMPPQMGYPQMGYPQMMPYGYPAYPPMYGQPMGYPPMGYPQMPVPAAPMAAPEPASAAPSTPPSVGIKLPDPSETGAKAPPPPAAPAPGASGEKKPSDSNPRQVEDIIQKYLKRRPTSGDKK